MEQKRPKIIVGMSGGVDSAVSLYLLKQQGFDPIGVTLKYALWESDNVTGKRDKELIAAKRKFNLEALAKAEKVCQQFGASHYIVDCQEEFKKEVIGYFLNGLKKNITPNPCVVCNKRVKIKHLLQFADENGISFIATGHYAQINKNKKSGKYELLKGKDKIKDQSYFLCLLGQNQLSRIIFPLGNYTKKKVYQIAAKNGLDYFSPQEQSQDLCFLSQKSIPLFLESEIGRQPGKIVDANENILGEHQGLHFYTIGQRRGINLFGGPWWVTGFNKNKNYLIVTNNKNDAALYTKEIVMSDYHFISDNAPKKEMKVMVKPRYLHSSAKAILYLPENGKLKLAFSRPQKLITPGQWVVFFDGKICLGGGIIGQCSHSISSIS